MISILSVFSKELGRIGRAARRTPRLIHVNARPSQADHDAVMIEERPKPTLACPHCGKPMRLAQVIPGIGALPELLTFECKACAEVTTKATQDLKPDCEEIAAA